MRLCRSAASIETSSRTTSLVGVIAIKELRLVGVTEGTPGRDPITDKLLELFKFGNGFPLETCCADISNPVSGRTKYGNFNMASRDSR